VAGTEDTVTDRYLDEHLDAALTGLDDRFRAVLLRPPATHDTDRRARHYGEVMLTHDGTAHLHAAMADRVDRGELPGLVTLVASGDDVHVDAIGRFGFDTDQPMRLDTVFRLASLTKPVIAAAAMTLVDDGVFTPADTVDRWLPELADRQVLARIDGPLDETVPADRPLTIDDLLTFRLGFGHVTEPTMFPDYPIVTAPREMDLVLEQPDPRTPYGPDEWMKRFATLPFMDQAGLRWRYNVGSLLLGVLLARAAGGPLGDLLRERIFEPLGMRDTGFTATAAQGARMPGYYVAAGAPEPVLQAVSRPADWLVAPAFPSGAAGLLSTIDDFHAFTRMLRDGGVGGGHRLLSADSVAAMTRNQLTDAQISTAGMLLGGQGWGYGVAVATTEADGQTPGQYGWSGGYGTTWFTEPGRDLIAIAFTQLSDFLWNGHLTEFGRLATAAVG